MDLNERRARSSLDVGLLFLEGGFIRACEHRHNNANNNIFATLPISEKWLGVYVGLCVDIALLVCYC